MSQLSSDECIAEIQNPYDKVKELTGTEMTLFRPPYGDYNNTLIESANTLGYHVIQWSVDSLDWKDYGADSIVDTILNHKALGDGAIILMHNGANTPKTHWSVLSQVFKTKWYEIVPISQLIWHRKISYGQYRASIQRRINWIFALKCIILFTEYIMHLRNFSIMIREIFCNDK